MKKMFVAIVLCLMSFIVCCDGPAYYTGKDIDLYTQATEAILGVKGIGMKGSAPKIEIIEEDSYGRRLFIYQCDIPSADEEGMCAILISQKSTNQYVYFYPNYSYVLVKVSDWLNFNQSVSLSEIDGLKEANDWNEAINIDVCTKKEIKSIKETVEISKTMKNNFEKMFQSLADKYGYLGNDSIYRYAIYSTSDVNGKTLYYVYGLGRDFYNEGVSLTSANQEFHLAVILNADGFYDINKCYIELIDMRNYQDNLKHLKELNDWQDY